MFYARVIPRTRLVRGLDHFVYTVPPELEHRLRQGSFVWIHLRGKKLLGLVWSVSKKPPAIKKIAAMDGPIENLSPLSEDYCVFLDWFARYYGISLGLALKICVPDAVLRKRLVVSANLPPEFIKIPSTVVQDVARLTTTPPAQPFAFYAFPTLHHRWVFYIGLLRQQNAGTCIVFPTIREAETFFRLLPRDCRNTSALVQEPLSKNDHRALWDAIETQAVRNVIGTKSAIFFPYTKHTRFVLDSEESSYHKNRDQNPRYHLKDILGFLHATQKNAVLYVGSKPSVETEHLLRAKRLAGFYIDTRPQLPVLVDKMREQTSLRAGDITYALEQHIQRTLAQGKRCVLFFNRTNRVERIQCRNCQSDIVDQNETTTCPKCHKQTVAQYSRTIADVQQELQNLFPRKRVAIFSSTEHIQPQADILLITSYGIEKIDWRDVGFFAILSFEHLLFPPTFSRNEAAWAIVSQFQTLAQTFRIPVWAIQARDITHPVLAALEHPQQFYDDELALRQQFLYPPFSEIIRLTWTLASKGIDQNALQQLLQTAGEILPSQDDHSIILRATKPLPLSILLALPPEVLVDRRADV